MPDVKKDETPKKPESFEARALRIFAASKSARLTIESRWARSNDLYDSQFPREVRKTSDVFLGQSRLFIPKTYNTVQRILVDLIDTFYFDPEELVDIISRPDIPEPNRQAVKVLLNYRLRSHPIDYYKELFEALQDSLKSKVGIFKIYPKFKLASKKTKTTNEAGEIVEMVSEEQEVVAFEPRIEAIPPEDLFLDPRFTWKDYWKMPMVHRYTKSRHAFKEMGFLNVDKVSGMGDASGSDAVKTQRARTGYQSPFFSPAPDLRNLENLVAYEFWDYMDLDNDGYVESVTYTMLGDVTGPQVLGLPPRPNTLPYRFSEFECVRPPFIIGQAFPEAHKGYGKDLPEVGEALQNETNSVRNQDREAAALSIRKPLLVNKDSGVDAQQLMNRKIGAVILGEETGPEMVRELNLSSPIINTAQISRQIDQDYSELTSITPQQLGLGSREETATGSTRAENNANKKIHGIIKNMANTLTIMAMTYLLRLEQAYETDEFIRKVTGQILGWRLPNDGTPTWAVIQGDFELAVDMGLDKPAQINKYLLVMDRMNQSNLSIGQLLQQGVVKAGDVAFFNPAWPMEQVLRALKIRDPKAVRVQAQQPPPPAEGEVKGVASQPGNNANPSVSTQNFNPEAFLANVAG